MILFLDENGNTFNGVAPYIHWINGQLSTGLWYTLKLMILSDSSSLQTSQLDSNSIFKFINPQYYVETTDELDLDTISTDQVNSTGTRVTVDGVDWFVHQIILVCESDAAGEFIEEFTISGEESRDQSDQIDKNYNNDFNNDFNRSLGPQANPTVKVGVDLYDENESLSINLSNRGLELPVSIQKAFLANNIHEDYTDFALINRKFKELVSNFIDVVDNKGSYKSLYNSLKWFEWGEGAKLYEIWKDNNILLEKELTPILSEKYQDLLYTHQKTTHLSLVASLQSLSDEKVDEERNPVLEDIAYQWSVSDLALKVSILGAFFERYFMPIHLDLKRACVETIIFTHQVKGLSGTNNYKYHVHDDTGVIDVEMDHTVVLGNIPFVAVGRDTMFGRKIDRNDYDWIQYIDPVGVESLEYIKEVWDQSEHPLGRDYNSDFSRNFGPRADPPVYYYPEYDPTAGYAKGQRVMYNNGSTIDTFKAKQPIPAPAGAWDASKWLIDNDMNDSIATVFLQLKGGVGVIVPIKVTVDIPEGDGLITETLTLYKEGIDPDTVIDRHLIMSEYDEVDKKWKVSFTFNLVSTQEEKVSFSLALYSLSGHVWTVASSYEAVDVSGSYLDICTVTNTFNDPTTTSRVTYSTIEEWINQVYNTYSTDNKNPYARLYEYLKEEPDIDDVLLTQYIPYKDTALTQFNQLVVVENDSEADTYNTSWINSKINNKFWIFHRAGEGDMDSENNPRYIMLLAKDPGVHYNTKAQWLSSMGVTGITTANIKRLDTIYVPQLHLYESIENKEISLDNYCFDENTLLCVFPQFKKNVHISHVSWKFKNMTTLEEFELNQPQAMPLVANNKRKLLSKGFWTVTMYYKLDGSSELHELKKNSAFKLI